MAPQAQYTPPEREDTSIWRNTPFLSDADRRARLAIGLEGMTLNPNQQYIQGLQGEVEARREQEQLNETAAWLQSQPGGGQFAQALLSGIPADQVFGAYMQSLAPQAGPDPTSAMQNYEFLLAQGVDPETAIASAFGGGGTNVNVDLGDQGPQIGTIPQGYQLVTDPETGAMSMAPIPGGPEDTSRPDAERIEQGAVGAVNVLETVGDLRRAVEESPAMTTGFIGSILANVPGSQAYDAQALTNTIRSNLAFDQLQAMREASPTGGALGAVSAPELTLLESNLANLDLGQSTSQALRQLEVIEREYTRILRKAYATSDDPAALDAIFGGRPSFILETGAVTTDMTDEELLQLYLNGGQ